MFLRFCMQVYNFSLKFLKFLAKKYLLNSLSKECAKFLETEINPDNVCVALSQALLYENEQLIKSCKSVFEESAHQIVELDAFNNVDKKTLLFILQIDELQIDEWD